MITTLNMFKIAKKSASVERLVDPINTNAAIAILQYLLTNSKQMQDKYCVRYAIIKSWMKLPSCTYPLSKLF